MAYIDGSKPDDLVDAIEASLAGQTITGNGGYSLSLKQCNEPTDISSGGMSWETGVFVVLANVAEIDPATGGTGSPPLWKWRASVEVQVTFRRPQDSTLRQGNVMILQRKIVNLIDQALMNAGSGQTIWPVSRRRLPPLTLASGAQEYYMLRYQFDVDAWWSYA